MGLKKCKDCGGVVSSNAKACPTCGAKVTKPVGILGWLFVIFIVLPIAWHFGTGLGRGPEMPAQRASAPSVNSVPANSEPAWVRRESKDDMTDASVITLSLRSTNGAEFDFPYKVPGGSHLNILVRKKGSELDVIFRVDKGHIQCNAVDCKFSLRIDDRPVQQWTGLKSTTHDSDLMFVRDADAFEKILMQGGRLRIGLEFFRQGTKVFEFETKDYPGF